MSETVRGAVEERIHFYTENNQVVDVPRNESIRHKASLFPEPLTNSGFSSSTALFKRGRLEHPQTFKTNFLG